jgi:hypothetical protein
MLVADVWLWAIVIWSVGALGLVLVALAFVGALSALFHSELWEYVAHGRERQS